MLTYKNNSSSFQNVAKYTVIIIRVVISLSLTIGQILPEDGSVSNIYEEYI